MGRNSQVVFRERERGRPAAVPCVSCSSCPQEARKEVADPGRRYSRVNTPALLYEELIFMQPGEKEGRLSPTTRRLQPTYRLPLPAP